MKPKALLLTASALVCFAGNSLLCRLALAAHDIDAAAFTAVRLASGAVVLGLLAAGRAREATPVAMPWASAAILFAYAAPFSYAYLRLGAAMGALIMFAAVQATMIGWGVVRGERPGARAWIGIVVALAGLVGLTLPGRSAPDALGTAGMALAGIAWGAYSLRGRLAPGDPLMTTAASFMRSLPFVAVLLGVAAATAGIHASSRGILLATASGALASGLGYSIWYAALRHLSATRAAVLQLLVPILAACGAIAWLDESMSLRFVVASCAILGGVGLTIADRSAARAVGPLRSR